MHCTKISAEFEFGGHAPLGAHPQNVALGYDVGKISVCCLVAFTSVLMQTNYQLENVAIIAMYCHLRPPDAIA